MIPAWRQKPATAFRQQRRAGTCDHVAASLPGRPGGASSLGLPVQDAGMPAATHEGAPMDEDRAPENDTGDIADPAQSLTAEGMDDAIAASLREHLDALDRAEQRLGNGTYGRSGRSGLPLPDERLEADPAAELTVEEAQQDSERAR